MSHHTDPPPPVSSQLPPRTTSLAATTASSKNTTSLPQEAKIPPRTNSKKRKPNWDEPLTQMSHGELQSKVYDLQRSINTNRKKLKPSTSFDSEFWSRNADIARLCQDHAGMNSRIDFLNAVEADESVTLEQWQEGEKAQNYDDQYLAYQQKVKIADVQVGKLRERIHDIRDRFMRLFVNSKLGFNVANTGVGPRETKDPFKFVESMLQA